MPKLKGSPWVKVTHYGYLNFITSFFWLILSKLLFFQLSIKCAPPSITHLLTPIDTRLTRTGNLSCDPIGCCIFSTRDVPIIGSAISNSLYIRYNWWAVTSLMIIKFLGSHLVAKKPYLIKTLRFTLILQQPTYTKC